MSGKFISHSGAAAGQGNLHELRWEGGRLWLDCGVDIGAQSHLDGLSRPGAVWISHAHADHCGGLLELVSRWPRVPLVATHKTKQLLSFALADGGRDASRRAEAVARRVQAVPYNKFRVVPGCEDVELMALRAGHVPGAAMAVVSLPDGTHVLYTGDFCTHDQPMTTGAGVPRLRGERIIDAVVSEAMLATDQEADRLDWDDEADRLVEAVDTTDGPVLIGVNPIGESVEVAALLARSDVSAMVDEYLRDVFEVCRREFGEGWGRLDFGGRRRMKQRLRGGGVVIAVGDQYQRRSTANHLAKSLVEQSNATLVVLNRARSRTGAGRLVESKHGEVINWSGRSMTRRAKVIAVRLINHAPRWQLEALIRGVAAAKTLLVHGSTGARWALKRSLEKGGFDEPVAVVERGESEELVTTRPAN